jgi:hypothetical protein
MKLAVSICENSGMRIAKRREVRYNSPVSYQLSGDIIMHNPASAIEQLALLRLDDIAEPTESKTEVPQAKRQGRPIRDLTGQRFGRLVVTEYTDERYNGGVVWICRCDCGSRIRLTAANFKSGTKSCGCLGNRQPYAFIPGGVGSRRRGAKTLQRQEESNLRSLYVQYRHQAIKRGYTWSLSREQFAALTKQDCHYCGVPPIQEHIGRYGSTNGKPYIYNGIDRADNAKGYEADNVVPCCGVCNRAKMDRDLNEFIEWVKRIAVRQQHPPQAKEPT